MSRRGQALLAGGLVLALLYPLLVRAAGAAGLPLSPNYLINTGMLICFTAFLGQSWNVAGGFAGLTSFGHVVFFGTGAYAMAILQVSHGWNPWLAWPVAAAAGAAVGWVIGALAFRAGLKGSYFALITLAFAEVFRILANSVPFTRGGLGLLVKADPRPANLQFRDPIWFYYLALGLCVLALLIAWRLTRTRFGARLVAIRENEDAARALGIDVYAEKVKVLVLSGAMAGAGGAFYVQKYLYVDPWIAFGVDKSVEMLLVSMVGGAGTIAGPLIGAAALTAINEVTRMLASVVPALKNVQPLSLVVYGAMLILIVARLPHGLASLFGRRHDHTVIPSAARDLPRTTHRASGRGRSLAALGMTEGAAGDRPREPGEAGRA
ncbi:branched-chain amino acid ABC transporter permease [Vineibacter terrae]|uniref:branched-chain amino acid ABC transporter permease n=1 Tax=Vineibacter terrae TaxID=2586908 RepID=UPI002E33663D|nr:branched-chain amino acid ABC transporter permease [Vineibacter terrae]HEX2889264.1 branched-chain amino acid ABC transporter permease [Vineibacter terrae]